MDGASLGGTISSTHAKFGMSVTHSNGDAYTAQVWSLLARSWLKTCIWESLEYRRCIDLWDWVT